MRAARCCERDEPQPERGDGVQPGRGQRDTPQRERAEETDPEAERDTGHIEDEAVRAMLERLDLQEAGVSARLDSRF